MIYIDDKDPEGTLDPSFPPRNVTINRGVDAKEVYELLSEIGRGKFGTVYKCKEKETGQELAAKFVPIPKRDDRRNVEREVEIMNSLQHHLIIQLYAAYEYQKMMCVVLELVEGGELFDRVIDDDFVLTEKVCTVFVRQVCEAMQFIHRNNILHLDLKPENILCLTKEGNRIKIIDFGLARKFDPDKKLQILFGTPEFVAPEVVNFDSISYGTDMWSVGVICYVLLSGLSPFMGETDIQTMANVTIAKYDFDDEAFSNVSSEALDFITKLLVKDISARMSAAECLEHNWLKRRPKPPIAPKPVIIPPPKYITTAPSPPREPETVELETTKDNLKSFIERWEEHPNSPYVFDNGTNLIAPLRDTRRDSTVSSRACSPSPCDSICTTLEDTETSKEGSDETEKTSDEDKKKSDSLHNKNFSDYLHSFDRRNSDTSYILGKNPMGERLNLADEIRKLSDHLLMLSEINTKLERENNEISTTDTKYQKTLNGTCTSNEFQNFFNRSQSCIEDIKTSAKQTSKVNSVIKTTTTSTATSNLLTNKKSATTKISSLSIKLKSLDETPKLMTNGNTKNHETQPKTPSTKPKTIKLKNGFKQINRTESTDICGFGVPWTVTTKRTKFRVNQMSRDVPVGSPNTHQAFNLEDAANTTKDCLLHLLEKYNDTRTRTGTTGRHQSICVDWNMSDNLEYRSMSSINAFFQKHSSTGRNVQQLRARLEEKSNHS